MTDEQRNKLYGIYTSVDYDDCYRITNIRFNKPLKKIKDTQKLWQWLLDNEDEDVVNEYKNEEDMAAACYRTFLMMYNYDLTFDYEEVEACAQSRIRPMISRLCRYEEHCWFEAAAKQPELFEDDAVNLILPYEFYVWIPAAVREAIEIIRYGSYGDKDHPSKQTYDQTLKVLIGQYLLASMPISFD